MFIDYVSLLYFQIVWNLYRFDKNKFHNTSVGFPNCKFNYMILQHSLIQIPVLFLRIMVVLNSGWSLCYWSGLINPFAKFAKFLRTPFFMEHLRWLLLCLIQLLLLSLPLTAIPIVIIISFPLLFDNLMLLQIYIYIYIYICMYIYIYIYYIYIWRRFVKSRNITISWTSFSFM